MGGIIKEFFFAKEESREMKIVFLYRYISLIFTSFFFIIGNNISTFHSKIFIVLCISLGSMILTYLYKKNQNSSKYISILVFIEAIGSSFVLLPSGGFNSPYLLYFINTILIAALKLDRKHCWINSSIYLLASIGNIYLFVDKGNKSLFEIIAKQPNIILSVLLITAAIGLLSKFTKILQSESEKLIELNNQLVIANKKTNEAMEQIMSLYQAVGSLSDQRDRSEIIKLIVNCTKEITRSDTVFFNNILDEENKIIIEGNEDVSQFMKNKLRHEISVRWNSIYNSESPVDIIVADKRFTMVIVRSTYNNYGILGIETTGYKEDIISKQNIDQLVFLAQLSSIVIERSHLEEVNERLLVTEEQNRIADEIHDSILQKLFGMSCGIFALIKNLEKSNINEIKEGLNNIRNSTNNVMRELRFTIYGMSWKKDGVNTFEVDIMNYIKEIQRLNNVNITFKIKGNHELLSTREKKAVYRMICEGIGNGLRHGNANNVDITLYIKSKYKLLKIIDDGKGFDLNGIRKEKENGLGLRNIQNLTYSLNGEIDIYSEIGTGTSIEVKIPNIIQRIEKGEVV
ncbi:sensor histidine kinase [Oceanirhabdus seepicola]|uniref:histidine kinase n=1 Tax=Oceanirhabdus seepicola TaxID=2828781 RepID=A0A9J6P0J2_9CLOT|nr:ATP-binding protein [Oceanirhabdus seepicola]MCM1990226.1 hypothetical protein [Oceanirhabdus seepicola]